jgi:hypothetical protein
MHTTPIRAFVGPSAVLCSPASSPGLPPHARPEGRPWAAAPREVMRRRKGARMTEAGTLSIMRRGTGYQVRYASNNPHNRERLPRACPDEAHLAALLHHCGTESAVMPQVWADVRHGRMAVLLVALSAEQLQACFPPPPETSARGRQTSTRPPRGHALRARSRETRGEAEQRREELALLLEEAALAMGESHQLLASCHASR